MVVREPVLRHPTREQPWTDRRAAVEQAAKQPPLLDVVLRPGDALYLPRGYLHAAQALGETSAHLTVGVHTWTRAHLLTELLRQLQGAESLREPLPLGVDVSDPAAVGLELGETLDSLRAALREDVLVGPSRRLARSAATSAPAPSPSGRWRRRAPQPPSTLDPGALAPDLRAELRRRRRRAGRGATARPRCACPPPRNPPCAGCSGARSSPSPSWAATMARRHRPARVAGALLRHASSSPREVPPIPPVLRRGTRARRPAYATAPPATRLLLVEVPGPWGRRRSADSRLDRYAGGRLVELAGVAGARVLLVRRPGRHVLPPAGVPKAWALADLRPGREHVRWGTWRVEHDLLDLDLGWIRPRSPTVPPARNAWRWCARTAGTTCAAPSAGGPWRRPWRPPRPAGTSRECSHVGGDRFAANVLLVPTGELFGSLDEAMRCRRSPRSTTAASTWPITGGVTGGPWSSRPRSTTCGSRCARTGWAPSGPCASRGTSRGGRSTSRPRGGGPGGPRRAPVGAGNAHALGGPPRPGAPAGAGAGGRPGTGLRPAGCADDQGPHPGSGAGPRAVWWA